MELRTFQFLGFDRYDGDDLWIRWRITATNDDGDVFTIDQSLAIDPTENVEYWVEEQDDEFAWVPNKNSTTPER